MYQFIGKIELGQFEASTLKHQNLLKKILEHYENNNSSVKLTIEIVEKNISEQQLSFYNGFILKAANHFGNSFEEMQALLKAFYPIDISTGIHKDLSLWKNEELQQFIDKSTSYLAEYGFNF